MDITKPLENPELKKLLMESINAKTPEDRNKILELVFRFVALDARFLSVVEFSKQPEKTENGTLKIAEGTELKFPIVKNQEGKTYLPVYTDWEELRKNSEVEESPSTLVFSFDDYAGMILNQGNSDGFIINPFSKCNLIVSKRQIEHMYNLKNENKKNA